MNGARGRRVMIMKSGAGNGARRREIACISDFKMLTLAIETLIYARTAEIIFLLFDDTVCFTVRSLNVLEVN